MNYFEWTIRYQQQYEQYSPHGAGAVVFSSYGSCSFPCPPRASPRPGPLLASLVNADGRLGNDLTMSKSLPRYWGSGITISDYSTYG